jgi:hypothetical protein
MDQREKPDRIEPMLATEPTDSTQASEPTEPIDRIEPAEPTDKIDPLEPMERMDPLEPMLRIDPDEPAERDEPSLLPMGSFCRNGYRRPRGYAQVSRPLTLAAALSQARPGEIAWETRRGTGTSTTARSVNKGFENERDGSGVTDPRHR